MRVGLRGGAGGAPFIDRVRAGEVGPEDLEIEFRPGDLGELWTLVCDGIENDPGPYPETIGGIATSHRSESGNRHPRSPGSRRASLGPHDPRG